MSNCWDTNYQLGCHDGQAVLVRLVDDNNGQPAMLIVGMDLEPVVGATAANTTLGACPVAHELNTVFGGAVNIASGPEASTFDPLGNGDTWSPPSTVGLLQSVTVTVLRGDAPATNNVAVRFGPMGAEVYLTAGMSQTWSVAQDAGGFRDFLEQSIRVGCNGDAAAVVSWTEIAQ